MANPKIIIVDDEAGIRQLVKAFLERYHFTVLEADCGQALFDLLKTETVDLIVLDLMLPDVYGIDICKEIRKTSPVPIIMLTAAQGEMNTVLGFEAGADDYVEKPFSAHVLLSRIQAILRRTKSAESSKWHAPKADSQATTVEADTTENFSDAYKTASFGNWTYLVEDACLKHTSGKHIFLTRNDCSLLELFLSKEQEILSREMIAKHLKLAIDELESRAIDVQVSRLRHKLRDRTQTNFIKSIRNKGYIFSAPVRFEH